MSHYLESYSFDVIISHLFLAGLKKKIKSKHWVKKHSFYSNILLVFVYIYLKVSMTHKLQSGLKGQDVQYVNSIT